MKRRVLVLVTSLTLAFVAVTGCTVKNQATDKICQPKQKSRCNDCPKSDPSDTRVYIGWNTCSDDGKSYIGSCSECAPEHPMASTPNAGPAAGGGEKTDTPGGTTALRVAPDDVASSNATTTDVGSPPTDPATNDSLPSGSSSGSVDTALSTADAAPATCHSATLSRDVPDLACAWSAGANDWEQCHDGHWYLGVFTDDTGTFGPTGTCSEIDDVP